MSETAVPQPAHANLSTSGRPLLWRPVLFRAIVTLAFGLTTVFWAAPGPMGLGLTLGAYFLASAAAQYGVVRALALPSGDHRRFVLQGAAGILAVGGVVVAISANTAMAAWLGGVALAFLGASELFVGLRKSTATGAKLALTSDWRISGVLGLGTGILLPFYAGAGPHALMGVAGGGALMTGALWALSALTLRHDGSNPKPQ